MTTQDLKSKRKALHITNQELATDLGISTQHLIAYWAREWQDGSFNAQINTALDRIDIRRREAAAAMCPATV